MDKIQLINLLGCSAGTIAGITGIRNYDEISKFLNWVYENYTKIEGSPNCLIAVEKAFKAYQLK